MRAELRSIHLEDSSEPTFVCAHIMMLLGMRVLNLSDESRGVTYCSLSNIRVLPFYCNFAREKHIYETPCIRTVCL